jgi:hypothetical protein
VAGGNATACTLGWCQEMKAASAQGLAAFLLVLRTIALFVIAIVQSFTGAAYFSHNFVRNQSSQPCQHGHTQQFNQHRFTLSGVPPFLSYDRYKVAGVRQQAMANMQNRRQSRHDPSLTRIFYLLLQCDTRAFLRVTLAAQFMTCLFKLS